MRLQFHLAKVMYLFLMFHLISCSSYIEKIHNQIDSDLDKVSTHKKKDKFEIFRNNDSNHLSSGYIKKAIPQIKRKYENVGKKRYQASDLIDNSDDGSLWSGQGQDNFLFSRNNYKENGDIVIIKVQEKLKKEISLELARAFPDEKKDEAKKEANNDKDQKSGTETSKEESTQNQIQANVSDSTGRIYDSISAIVIEQINKDHLLLRGRKEVLYKSRKRVVEVQALVPSKSVADDDSVISSNILESSISILR